MLKSLMLVLSLLPAAALSQTVWEAKGARVETVAYGCSSAMDELSVAYFNAPDGTSFAAVQVAGVVHAMVQDISGSGARYVDIAAPGGYGIHAKGEGLLLLKLAGEGAGEEQVLAECTALNG